MDINFNLRIKVKLIGKVIWYDFYTYTIKYANSESLDENGLFEVELNNSPDCIPLFIRGGSIVPLKETLRRTSMQTHEDPVQIIVALDENKFANGCIYVDDYDSTDYFELNEFLFGKFSSSSQSIEYKSVHNNISNDKLLMLSKITILGLGYHINSAEIVFMENCEIPGEIVELKVASIDEAEILILSKIRLSCDWIILLYHIQ